MLDNISCECGFTDKEDVMTPMIIQFTPLAPGEKPGDPELGGWRPLHPRFFKSSAITAEALPLSFEEAVRVVAARIARFQLRQAIEIVAQRLAN